MIDGCFHESCRFLSEVFLDDDGLEDRNVEALSCDWSATGVSPRGSSLCT